MATEFLTATDVNLDLPIEKSRRSFLDRHARLWMACMLILADLFSLIVSVLAASYIRQLPAMVDNPAYDQLFGLLVLIQLVLFFRKGLYPAVGMHYVDEIGHIVSSTSIAFLIILCVTFIFKTSHYYSRVILMIAWGLSLVLIPAIRYIFRRALIRWQLWGEPVVIIGEYKRAEHYQEHFRKNLQLGLRPVAIWSDDLCSDCIQGVDVRKLDGRNNAFVNDRSIKTALIVMDNLNDIDLLVERFRNVFQWVILIKDKHGRFGLDGFESLDFLDTFGLQVKNNLYNSSAKFLKRLIDSVIAILALVFLSPFWALIAIAIKLDSPGTVFYRQMRLGKNGEPLTLLKFRTMHQHADKVLFAELARDPLLKDEWERYQKLKFDPRITRVGRFLRKFSLDELPQLWNIASGEMSLVGPRPIMLNQRELYGRIFEDYIQVSPGITGLWQVSGRNQTTFVRRAELDREYIQHWSLWLDIFILLKTIKVVLWQHGAY